MKKTKIIATIGPTSSNKAVLKKLIEGGVNAIRINLSHSNLSDCEKVIKNARSIKDIPIIFDTQGPEIRIITKGRIGIKRYQKITIGFDKSTSIYFNRRFKIKKNQLIFVNEGTLKFKVVNNKAPELLALTDGEINNRARVNIPSVKISGNILSKTDIKLIKYGIKKEIDYVALSYTRNAKDIKKLQKVFPGGVIAKIENAAGIRNFNEILQASDGIMIARGDLGVEIKTEKLPLIQKELIQKCNQSGKLVITATQMLESMIHNPIPTRAETSDVANAILDGSDVVMLSGETAIGKYPIQAVKEMSHIARAVESSIKNKVVIDSCTTVSEAISKSIYEITQVLPITKIVTLTRTGFTARMISRFRINLDIIAITPNDSIKRKIQLYYGIKPIVFPEMETRKRIIHSMKTLLRRNLIKRKDLVLFTAGLFAVQQGQTNLIEIHKASDLLERNA